jgi:hypothetical protein
MAASGVGSANETVFSYGVLPRGICFRIRTGTVACSGSGNLRVGEDADRFHDNNQPFG